jgi:Skp family chaperone for outer membrane proteins
MTRSARFGFALAASALLSGGAFAQAVPIAPAPAAPPAAAAIPSPILIIDGGRLIRDSLAGKDMIAKLNAIGQQMQREAQAEANPLRTEAQSIQAATQGKTQQQVLADAALRSRVEAFQNKMQAQELKDQKRNAELQATEQQARDEFNRVAGPVVQAVITARNGLVLIDREQVSFASAGVDITSDVQARLDAATKTVNVTRVTLPDQPAQGAAPAAAGPVGPQPAPRR